LSKENLTISNIGTARAESQILHLLWPGIGLSLAHAFLFFAAVHKFSEHNATLLPGVLCAANNPWGKF